MRQTTTSDATSLYAIAGSRPASSSDRPDAATEGKGRERGRASAGSAAPSVRAIAEAALLLDVAALLILARVFLPFPGLKDIFAVSAVTPFVLLALRRGPRRALVATVACYLVVAALLGPLLALQALGTGALGTAFAWAARGGRGRLVTLAGGMLLYAVVSILVPLALGFLFLRLDPMHTLAVAQSQGHALVRHVAQVAAPLLRAMDQSELGRAILRVVRATIAFGFAHLLPLVLVAAVAHGVVRSALWLVVSIEVIARLPAEVRRDERGEPLVFFEAWHAISRRMLRMVRRWTLRKRRRVTIP